MVTTRTENHDKYHFFTQKPIRVIKYYLSDIDMLKTVLDKEEPGIKSETYFHVFQVTNEELRLC